MAAAIKVYTHDGVPQGQTSQAFFAKIVKELMRAYSLDFSVVNCNSIRQYLVPGCVVEAKGQKFDMTSFKQSSGTTNKTDVSGRHVSCRLTNYLIPIGYAFIGTAEEIAADILNVATDKNGNKANTEFSVGTCSNISGSFSLGNTQISTARAAIFAMKSLGVEADFDNFIVNLPLKCGTGKTKTYEFGKDLVSLDRTWDDSNGTSYAAKIADLQRIPGHTEDAFDVGDDCIIIDKFIGDVIQKRIISYTQCLDDPTQDGITIGVFVRDSADMAIAMQVDISAAQGTADKAQETADGSVQQDANYSNVSFGHEKGIYAELLDGTYTQMNGAGTKSVRTDGSYSLSDGTGFKNVTPDGSYTLMNAKGLTHHTGGATDTEIDYHYLSEIGTLSLGASQIGTVITITLPDKFKGKDWKVQLGVSKVATGGLTPDEGDINAFTVFIESMDIPNAKFNIYTSCWIFNEQFAHITCSWIAIA